jgi:hypothetical protein
MRSCLTLQDTLGRSAWKSLQDDARLLASNTEKAGKDVDRIAAVEHMHQTNQANKGMQSPAGLNWETNSCLVQLLENQKAEEFRQRMFSSCSFS